MKTFREFIKESKVIYAKFVKHPSITYDDILDWLEANGGYESLSEYAKGNFGIKSTWSHEDGSIYQLSKKEFDKFNKEIKEIGTLEEDTKEINPKKIKNTKDFNKLNNKQKLVVLWYYLSGEKISISNLKELKGKINTKSGWIQSNSTYIDFGLNSDSGIEESDLPFNLSIKNIKEIFDSAKK